MICTGPPAACNEEDANESMTCFAESGAHCPVAAGRFGRGNPTPGTILKEFD